MTQNGVSVSPAEAPGTRGIQWQVILRREILAICLYIFLADLVIGMIVSTFSLFATSLGASLVLIGALTALRGVSRFVSGITIGNLSDRYGRRILLQIGMACLLISCAGFAVISNPVVLLPVQVVLGVGFIATLSVAFAYATDVTPAAQHSLVIGLLATCMGLGFALGSQVAGQVASRWGYPATYALAAGLALAGLLMARLVMPPARSRSGARLAAPLPFYHEIGQLLADPVIAVVCLCSLLMSTVFGALIVTFFPVYAGSLGITQALLGTMFAVRALMSTLSRLPAGIVDTMIGGYRVLMVSLFLSTLVCFGLTRVTDPRLLTLLLVVEGIGFGMFLTTGQAAMAGRASEASRGAALGLFMAAQSFGEGFVPLFLGFVAQAFGVPSVFTLVGVAGVAITSAVFWILIIRPQRHLVVS